MWQVCAKAMFVLCCALVHACSGQFHLTPQVQANAAQVPALACYRRVWTLGGELACLNTTPRVGAPEAPLMCLDVEPEAVVLEDGSTCDPKFLYRASDGKQYVVVPAGCVLGAEGESQWDRGTGPQAWNSDGGRIGEFSYAILRENHDLAVIRLDSPVPVDPRTCRVGEGRRVAVRR